MAYTTGYIQHLTDHKDELLAFLNRIVDPVEFEDAWEHDSRLFFTPGMETIVLQRPDGYVIEIPVANPVDVFGSMRSARAIDVMCQMFEDPELPA